MVGSKKNEPLIVGCNILKQYKRMTVPVMSKTREVDGGTFEVLWRAFEIRYITSSYTILNRGGELALRFYYFD